MIFFNQYLKEANIVRALQIEIRKKYKKEITRLKLTRTYVDEPVFEIDYIVVKKVGLGVGSKVFKDIVKFADKNKQYIGLQADASLLFNPKKFASTKEANIDTRRLVKFYMSFGFQLISKKVIKSIKKC